MRNTLALIQISGLWARLRFCWRILRHGNAVVIYPTISAAEPHDGAYNGPFDA